MGRITERYDEYLQYADYNGDNEDELFELMATQAKLLAEKGVSLTLSASTNALKIYVNSIYSGKITPYHNHEYYEINYVHKGKIAEYIDGHKLVLKDGEAILMSPSVKHTSHPIGESVAVNIIVSPEYAEAAEKMLSSYSPDNYLKLIVKNSVYAVFHGANEAGVGEIVDELARFNQNRWQYEPYVEPSLENLSKRLFLALTRAELYEHSYQKITRFSEAVKKEFAWMWNDAAPPIRVNDEIVTFSHVIRKLAHLAEFGLLGLLWGGCGRSYDRRLLWLGGLPTGVVDECLQFFAPGRAPLVADVVLDTAGYLCGTAVILLVTHLWRKKKN